MLFFATLLLFFRRTTVYTIYTMLWRSIWHGGAISTTIDMYVIFASRPTVVGLAYLCLQDLSVSSPPP